MAEGKKRFSFDDEEDILHDTVEEPVLPKEEITHDTVYTDVSQNMNIKMEEPREDKTMKKKKKKFSLRVWHIIVLVALLLFGLLVTYIFMSTNNDGPVYGDRCVGLIAIDENKFEAVEQEVLAVAGIQSIDITKNCRMIDIVITYDEHVGADDAQTLALHALQTLDVALGEEKENVEDPYSKVFGFANGRGQYNANFRLRSAGENADFPIFGTKQPRVNEVSFTRASPVNPETTDRVNGNANQENNE